MSEIVANTKGQSKKLLPFVTILKIYPRWTSNSEPEPLEPEPRRITAPVLEHWVVY
jgi:hypothetical protein